MDGPQHTIIVVNRVIEELATLDFNVFVPVFEIGRSVHEVIHAFPKQFLIGFQHFNIRNVHMNAVTHVSLIITIGIIRTTGNGNRKSRFNREIACNCTLCIINKDLGMILIKDAFSKRMFAVDVGVETNRDIKWNHFITRLRGFANLFIFVGGRDSFAN
jgi:hypothetical protein